jgi:hypothetical protein
VQMRTDTVNGMARLPQCDQSPQQREQ